MVLLGGCLVVALWFLEGPHEHGHGGNAEEDHHADEHAHDHADEIH